MHGAWGAFWLAYGLLFGLVAAHIVHVPPLGAAQPELGFWFIMLAAVTGSGALASLAESGGLFALLAPLAVGSGILGVGFFVGTLTWVHVAGWVLVFSAGIAWYVATAMMFEGAFGRIILPLFKYRRAYNVPGARPSRPVEYEYGQPGVKQGQ
jgi:succinate-acetate transporter protein